jgi:hypothetical protein
MVPRSTCIFNSHDPHATGESGNCQAFNSRRAWQNETAQTFELKIISVTHEQRLPRIVRGLRR